ncbi:MAG: branched-chain amino acid ABC transporter permease [Halobacteriota archaeon]
MVISTLAEVTIDGVARGLLLAILGTAITLVFGLGSILNIALGAFAVLTVIVAVWATDLVVHPALGALVGLAGVAGLSLLVDRGLLSSVYRSEGEERITVGIFVTLGLEVMLAGILAVTFTSAYSVDFDSSLISLGGVRIRSSSILIIVTAAVVLTTLIVFLRRTYLGKATRTVFQDETGALLCGIDPRIIRTLIFVTSGLLAGIAGILWSIQAPVRPGFAFTLTVFAVIVSIVGGVRDVRGTIAAGVLLGLVWTHANFWIGSSVAMVILFAVAVIVLILRPEEIS